MIAGWFDASEAEQFGNELAEFYDEKFRANTKAGSHKKEEKQKKLVDQVLLKARQYGATNKPNFFKKAKLGNAFKWKLKDLGYDDELVDLLTKDVLFALR